MRKSTWQKYVLLGVYVTKTLFNSKVGAMKSLHEESGNPVVHRDVKPNNVMLDSDYNAHLGDFGLARLLQNENAVTTMIAGTPGYLAPEVSFTGRARVQGKVRLVNKEQC